MVTGLPPLFVCLCLVDSRAAAASLRRSRPGVTCFDDGRLDEEGEHDLRVSNFAHEQVTVLLYVRLKHTLLILTLCLALQASTLRKFRICQSRCFWERFLVQGL